MKTGTEIQPPSQEKQVAKGPGPQEDPHTDGTASQEPLLADKLADEVRLRRFTESVLDARQDELQIQESENKKLSKNIESLQKELAEAQRQLIEARNQTQGKTKQLQVVKDRVSRLRPRRKDIAESEAHDAYKKLCGSVQRWVQNRIPPVLEEMESERFRGRPADVLAARLASLIREPARRCLGAYQSDEHHVVAIIMYYIWLALFTKPFHCPLDGSDDDATIGWIDELESTMSKLPRGKRVASGYSYNTYERLIPPWLQDPAHCREWRSETLTALTNQPLFKSRRAKHIGLVCQDLTALLSLVVPEASHADLQISVRRALIEPAADLAHRMLLASSIYSLKWPARNACSRLEVYECINLMSGGLVLDLRSSSSARQQVTYLFDLAPGLFVEGVEVGKKGPLKAICRPNVLVYAGDGEVPQRPTLMKWLYKITDESARDPLQRAVVPRGKTLSSIRSSKL